MEFNIEENLRFHIAKNSQCQKTDQEKKGILTTHVPNKTNDKVFESENLMFNQNLMVHSVLKTF